MTVPSKQIIKIQAAFVRVSGFTANGASNSATTAITTALSTAGAGGVSVPLQPSVSEGLGLITTGANNRVEVYDATSKDKIMAANGEEVYGRLTEASGTYTLSFYTLPNTGVETSYSFANATSIDFEFPYRFDFYRFPTDGAIAIRARNVSDDPASSSGAAFAEQLTVTATNTLSAISKTPINASTFQLRVNGIDYDTFGSSVARVAVNLTTKAVTWSAANAGFNLETTDRVVARYFTFE